MSDDFADATKRARLSSSMHVSVTRAAPSRLSSLATWRYMQGEKTRDVLYSLYGVDPSLRTLIKNLLLLNYGDGQINILGLFDALAAVTPALLWMLEKKLHWVVIAASWAMYIYYSIYHTTILPFQSRNAFPFLAWQLLYVHGLLAGRDEKS